MSGFEHLTVRGLRVSFQGCEVVHGIDLSVEKGEFVAIVGKSGSGKSTLLHALAGFIDKEGEVQIPRELGMVFQNYAVFPWLTVRGNLAFGLGSKDPKEREALVNRVQEMLGLAAEAHKYPAQLSGGQAQRVALGRAIAPDPEVILMDEPFGALDLYTRERMQTWLLDIWEKEHKTVLFVTHSIEEAIFLADRVVVLGRGLVLGEFPVPFSRPRTAELKFGTSFVELKRQIVETMEPSTAAAALPVSD
jgi:NitT/TauT family transport system ATP-binding protein